MSSWATVAKKEAKDPKVHEQAAAAAVKALDDAGDPFADIMAKASEDARREAELAQMEAKDDPDDTPAGNAYGIQDALRERDEQLAAEGFEVAKNKSKKKKKNTIPGDGEWTVAGSGTKKKGGGLSKAAKEEKDRAKKDARQARQSKVKAKKIARDAADERRSRAAVAAVAEMQAAAIGAVRGAPIAEINCEVFAARITAIAEEHRDSDEARLRALSDVFASIYDVQTVPEMTAATAQVYPLCELPRDARTAAATLVRGTSDIARATAVIAAIPVSAGIGAAPRVSAGERLGLRAVAQLILRHSTGVIAIAGATLAKEIAAADPALFAWALAQSSYTSPAAAMRVWSSECLPLLARRKPAGGAGAVSAMMRVVEAVLRTPQTSRAVREAGVPVATPEQFATFLDMCSRVTPQGLAQVRRDLAVERGAPAPGKAGPPQSLEMIVAARMLVLLPSFAGATIFATRSTPRDYLDTLLATVCHENAPFRAQTAQLAALSLAHDPVAMRTFASLCPAWLPETLEICRAIAARFHAFPKPVQAAMRAEQFRRGLTSIVDTLHRMIDGKYRPTAQVQSRTSKLGRSAKPDRDILEDALVASERASEAVRPMRRWPLMVFLVAILAFAASHVDWANIDWSRENIERVARESYTTTVDFSARTFSEISVLSEKAVAAIKEAAESAMSS